MKTIIFFLAFFLIGFSTLKAQNIRSSIQRPTFKTGQNTNDKLLKWAQSYVRAVPPTPKLKRSRGLISNSFKYQYMVAKKAKTDRILADRCSLACINDAGDPYFCTNVCECVYIHGGSLGDCVLSKSNNPSASKQKATRN